MVYCSQSALSGYEDSSTITVSVFSLNIIVLWENRVSWDLLIKLRLTANDDIWFVVVYVCLKLADAVPAFEPIAVYDHDRDFTCSVFRSGLASLVLLFWGGGDAGLRRE